jgi:O-methyltransferase
MRQAIHKLLQFKRAAPVTPANTFEDDFVGRATGQGADTPEFRRGLVERFSLIHRSVVCAHQEAEMLILAEAILNLGVEGPLVELGCYKGGSSAKLSLVARATGRTLYVCDSFEGLPAPAEFDAAHQLTTGKVKRYAQGDYCGTYDEVLSNVTAWGAIDSCKFVKGFYSETLPALDVEPALVFMDVDLIESGHDALQHLWPRLRPGGRYFTHEATARTFVYGLLDPEWWHQTMKRCPPILFGAGHGFGPHALNLAYLEKGDGV